MRLQSLLFIASLFCLVSCSKSDEGKLDRENEPWNDSLVLGSWNQIGTYYGWTTTDRVFTFDNARGYTVAEADSVIENGNYKFVETAYGASFVVRRVQFTREPSRYFYLKNISVRNDTLRLGVGSETLIFKKTVVQ